MKYELAILGGGPAGVSAGVYASRKKLKTIFITDEWGGQSNVSDGIENWIGTIKLSGQELADSLKEHLKAYANDVVDIKDGIRVEKVEKKGEFFLIKTNDGNEYEAQTVLVATGSHRRKIDIPGAKEFENKGITYCATCDGPIFSGQDVAVIGGGNSAFESAAQLLAYAKSVTLIHRRDTFRADPVTVNRVTDHENMRVIKNAELKKVVGDKMVTGLVYRDKETGEEKELPVTGVFVEIGSIPTTGFVKDVVDLNEIGEVVVDPKTQQTSQKGAWAAGDCTDGLYHQNNIAAGDAVKALEDIYNHLRAK